MGKNRREEFRREEMNHWKPIETAPKGEYILTYHADEHEKHGYPDVSISYFNGSDYVSEGCEGCLTGPTHWMPLPRPPVKEGEIDWNLLSELNPGIVNFERNKNIYIKAQYMKNKNKKIHYSEIGRENSICGHNVKMIYLQMERLISMMKGGLFKNDIGFFEKLYFPVCDFIMSSRHKYFCEIKNILYIGDLVQISETEFLRAPNMGIKSLIELQDNLEKIGLNLGMNVKGWERPQNV